MTKALLFTKHLAFIISLLISNILFSQNYKWAKSAGGKNVDSGNSIDIDGLGNVYTVGSFSDSVDFNPGIDTALIVSNGGNDMFLQKLDGNGNFVFIRRIGGLQNEDAKSVFVDNQNNIYVTGLFEGSITLETTLGNITITSAGLQDCYFAKYNENGDLLWIKSIGGVGFDIGNGIQVDSIGNVFIAGQYELTADFDPAITNLNITSTGAKDLFIAKYDSFGNYLWAKSIGSIEEEKQTNNNFKLDPNGNLILIGDYISEIGFDSAGVTVTLPVYSTNEGEQDLFITKYDSNGNFKWAKQIGGLWGYCEAKALAVGLNGYIYITGLVNSFVDFDPDPITTYEYYDQTSTFFAKYDDSGNLLWANFFGGPLTFTMMGEDFFPYSNVKPNTIEVDYLDNIYIGGSFRETVDFDPDEFATATASTINVNGTLFISKYNSNGHFVSVKRTGQDINCFGLSVKNNGNIYLAGNYRQTQDFNPSAAANYLSSNNNSYDAFSEKFCQTINTSNIIYGPNTVCQGAQNISFYVSPIDYATSYIWSLPAGATIVSGANTNNIIVNFSLNSQNGNITVRGVNECGQGPISPIFYVTMNLLPSPGNIITGSNVFCEGQAAGVYSTTSITNATSYNWTIPSGAQITSAQNTNSISVNFNGSAGGDIFVNGVNSCGVGDSSSHLTVTIRNLPTVLAVATDTTICLNNEVILYGAGAATYTWSSGINNNVGFNPSSTATYSVNGVDTYGCEGNASITINVVRPITPAICFVTVDSLSINNLVIWDKTLYPTADTFYVYRDTSNNTYALIGAVSANQQSLFIDTARSIGSVNGDPNITTYRYKISYIDTCGNASPLSPYHNTIYQYNIGGLFLWNQYEIEGQPIPVPGLSGYSLKRDNLGGTGNYVLAASAGAASTNVNDPLYSTYQNTADWRIETNWNITCNGFLRPEDIMGITKSRSNIKNNRSASVGIKTNSFHYLDAKIYPNPAADVLNIEAFINNGEVVDITIENMLGQVVYSTKTTQPKTTINTSSFNTGVYFVKVKTAKGISLEKVIVE